MKKFTKCMVIIALCLAMTAVGAWALKSITFNTGGRIFFEVEDDNVYFDLGLEVYTASKPDADLVKDTSVQTFTYAASKGAASVAPDRWTLPDIGLTASVTYVVYEFTITNNGDKNMEAALSVMSGSNTKFALNPPTSNNVTIAAGTTETFMFTAEYIGDPATDSASYNVDLKLVIRLAA